ncbi:MAG TPA: hypothetical protein ENK09_02310 [Nitrospirae bacterium]|nr:hypothetical protein [Nitrospirota bacterium]
MERNEILLEIKNFLNSRDDVLLAFVFGSFIEDRQTEESDIDIAILFKQRPDFSTLTEIIDTLSGIAKREADIVVLNDSSPIIRMQVLKKGRLIKKINDSVYNDFFTRTIKEYDDLKRIRKEQEKNILRGRIYARS